MKDRSSLAVSLSVIALIVILVAVIAGGMLGRRWYHRANGLAYRAYKYAERLEFQQHINQLEFAVLKVALMRAQGTTPNPQDVSAIAAAIEGISLADPPVGAPDEAKQQVTKAKQDLAQWKQQMLIQLQVPAAAAATGGTAPEPATTEP